MASLSPYQNRSPSFLSGNVVAHLERRLGCCNWCVHALSSMVDSVAAQENRHKRVVVCTKRCGGRTMMSVLS